MNRRFDIKAGIVGASMIAVAALPVSAADLTTGSDLLNAADDPNNWLTHHRTYDGKRYSPLDQINKSNVQNLKIAFTLGLGGTIGAGPWKYGNIEGTPIVENGIMYMPNGWSELYKINVAKGASADEPIEWIFDPAVDREWAANVTCCAINNRGVALFDDSIIMSVLDGRMFRINKDSGEAVWEIQLAEPAIAETITVAPLVITKESAAKNLAITGVSGAEYGIRGWMAAVDIDTGKEEWRRYTVPGPGEAGFDTWTDDYGAWLTGGGSNWQTSTYDPATNSVYVGVGNPGPDWDHEYRPGDNLYTSGMFVLDGDTGFVKWHFQYTPNDPYDFDGINEHILVEQNIAGENRKAFIHADRNGFFYAVDSTNGEFIYGVPFVREINWTTGLDKVTGLPLEYRPDSDIQTYVTEHTPNRTNKTAMYCPNIIGGKNWMPMSYSPKTGLAYVPTIESCITVNNVEEIPGKLVMREWFTGGGPPAGTATSADGSRQLEGSLTAVEVSTGRIIRKFDTKYPVMSGVLSTGGGLVFAARHQGKFCAHDDLDLDELWCFATNTSMDAPTMTFSTNGKQYIAVATGGHGIMPQYFMDNLPGLEKVQTANVLFVFSL